MKGFLCVSFLNLVCDVLPGVILQSAQGGTESNQTSGQISVCQNGGLRLFLVILSLEKCLKTCFAWVRVQLSCIYSI